MNLVRGLRRFAAFNAVGLATTAVGIPLMAGLDFCGVTYPVYTAANYLLGIVLGFWLNFRYSFRDRQPSIRRALWRYLVGFLSLLVLVQGLQWQIIDRAHWHRLWGVGLGMVVYGGLGAPPAVGAAP